MASNRAINFFFDVSDVAKEFRLSKTEVEVMSKMVLNDVTVLILRNWKAHASRELKSTRLEYNRNLKWIESGRLQNTLVLMGKLPNMLEFGAGAFDMKEGFSKSSKVKISALGKWYLTIPFRFATPNALGESTAFSSILPKEVYQSIKDNVGKSKTNIAGVKMSGGSLKAEMIPQNFAGKGSREAIGNFPEYKHKTSIYEGITRASNTYESATQSKYVSFRRVGENSDPMAFIHSGIKAYNLAEKAVRSSDLNTQVENSIDKFLSRRR